MPYLQPGGFPEPGETSHRHWDPSSYSPYQDALWQVFDQLYQAREHGFLACFQPDPDLEIDPERYEAWLVRLEAAFAYEAHRDSGTRGLTREDFPQAALRYWYQVGVAAVAERIRAEGAGLALRSSDNEYD